ncbi:hypothetical protein DFH06DRAFT_1134957 [Mycena polygramma]|nr:hypothetical protein DFH06DRAFT_1134957 [Mycena polygramma]
MSPTTTTTATTTRTTSEGPYTLTATPLAMATSTSYTSGDTPTPTSTSGTPTTPTTMSPAPSAARVRFDAECVLIPDLGLGAGSKRPRMVTKSYSLPLWRKPGHSSHQGAGEEEDAHAHVVLKVALPRSVFLLSFTSLCFTLLSLLRFTSHFLPLFSSSLFFVAFLLDFARWHKSTLAAITPRPRITPPIMVPCQISPNGKSCSGSLAPHGDASVSRFRRFLVRLLSSPTTRYVARLATQCLGSFLPSVFSVASSVLFCRLGHLLGVGGWRLAAAFLLRFAVGRLVLCGRFFIAVFFVVLAIALAIVLVFVTILVLIRTGGIAMSARSGGSPDLIWGLSTVGF